MTVAETDLVLYQQYFLYYQAPLKIEQLRLQRDKELKELERDVGPATVRVFYGRLVAIKPINEFVFVLKRDEVRDEYEILKRDYEHHSNVFLRAFTSVLSEDEQKYYKTFYACDNDDERFHTMNLCIQEKIIELEKGTANEWYWIQSA